MFEILQLFYNNILNDNVNDEFVELGILLFGIQWIVYMITLILFFIRITLLTTICVLLYDDIFGTLNWHSFGSDHVRNPGDYVDDDAYDAVLLLLSLAENDVGNHGAPPASVSIVEKLDNVVIENEGMDCVICMEFVDIGEVAKILPCGHGYHGECITTWLFSRNSCPVCRFELPTDDPEYENRRKRRSLEID